MRKSFQVVKSGENTIFSKLLQEKYIELFFGSVIISFLFAGSIMSYVKYDSLIKTDVRNQPPQIKFFQRILYNPPEYSVIYNKKINQAVDLFEDWEGSDNDNLFELVQSPEGMVVNKKVKELIWTPSEGQKGMTNVELVIHQNNGKKAVISNVPDFTAVIGRTYLFQLKFNYVNSEEKDSDIIVKFPITVSENVHPLGTDVMGRDIISCIILGARYSIIPGLIVILISIGLGTVIGGFAGYYGGIRDHMLGLIIKLFAVFPSLLIIFLSAAIFDFNIYLVMLAVGLVTFPRVAIGIRNKVLTLKKRQFIEAAQELGLSDSEIFWKDIIWYNARGLIITNVIHSFAFAILIEVTLSYLKLGVQGRSNSWGNLLQYGRDQMYHGQFWLVLIPIFAVAVSIMGFYMLGDGLNKLYVVEKGNE